MISMTTIFRMWIFLCIATSANALNIQLNPNILQCGTAVVNVSTNCNFNGTAQVTIDGNPAGIFINNVTPIGAGSFLFTVFVTPNAPATAVVRVRLLTSDDPTGCALAGAEATANVAIQCACAVTLNVSGTNESCFGCSNGTAQASLNGAGGMVSYTWSNGAAGQSITGLSAGSYTVTASDAAGCTASGTVIIQPYVCTPLSVQLSVVHATCHDDCDGSIQLGPLSNGSTAYTVMWNEGQTSTFRQDLCAATYQFTITDTDNCTLTSSAQVMQPDAIIITVGAVTHATAAGPGQATFNLAGIQPSAYCEVCDWLGICSVCGDLNITSGSTSAQLQAGCYVLRITNPNGCTAVSDSVCIQDLSSSAEWMLKDRIQLSPNPASDMVRIENHSDAVIRQIIIRNPDGRVLFLSNDQREWIDTSDLLSGMYVVTIMTGRGNITRPLVILR
ncbi:MAG: T9SS type A sorting domain-containing protein [Saprospiraceae bacterium]|nr:T9SS type A sorting domain-containing protein [Saprospiraceae bacterium]